MMFSSICILGLGYIGLPTACMFAKQGIHVIGVDVNDVVVQSVNTGKLHFVEPDIDELLQTVVNNGQLCARKQPEPADAFIIAVPTPFQADHKPDLSFIHQAAYALAPVLQKNNLVILESTSPVGTTVQLEQWLATARPDLTFPYNAGEQADICLAYCPERVLPGKISHELIFNDRIIGGRNKKSAEKAQELYSLFVKGDILLTNDRTAEMSKLAENSFRDVNIAFANELSVICDKLDIDVWELIQLANRHPRVQILQPGCGVGGHCIAVDPWFIVDSVPEQSRLIRTAREVNDLKQQWVLDKVKCAVADVLAENPQKTIYDVSVACLGLSFKPDIDDLRESPALYLTEQIAQLHCKVLVVEPNIQKLPPQLHATNVKLVKLDVIYNHVDVVCLFVRHREFILAKENLFNMKSKVLDFIGLNKN